MSKRVQIRARIEPDGRIVELVGREAWAMRNLVTAGEKGCTPIDNPGPRWSGYVYSLRGYGFVIETIHERHAGPFPGSHARYVLRTGVTILEDEMEGA